MAYMRDPLSVRYDGQTGELLNRLYARERYPAQATLFIRSPGNDPPDDVFGDLTRHERAFLRSLYYLNKRHRPRRSVRVEWGAYLPNGARGLTVTMFTGTSGRDHAEDNSRTSYVEHSWRRSRGLNPGETTGVLR